MVCDIIVFISRSRLVRLRVNIFRLVGVSNL